MTRCLRPLLRLLVLGAAFAPVAGASASTPVEGDQLEQVVLLSRHNLRAPLVESGALQQATPQSWAQWPVAAGELTTKGGVLEVYLGHYLRRTLAAEGMLPVQGCPAARDFHAYANSLQRTQATAQFFIAGAFPGCALMVEQRRPLGTMDPVFNPLIVRDDAGFRQRALRAMQQAEKRAALAPPLAVLDAISDYPRSPACAGRDDCRLSAGGTRFAVEPGREPSASGALALANGMVDAMLMEYYQGVPLAQIGWGRLRSPAQWQALAAVRNGYQDILFGTPEVAREVAAPLLAHLRALFADPQAARVTLLVGHDSNIGAVLAALGAADYQLPGQYERTPIGGLLRFERWRNRQSGEQRLRLFYVYPSAAQLRDVTVLDDEHPPGKVLLKLPACGMDHEGFCRWPRFTALLDPAG